MRHRKKFNHLSRTSAHRKAMLANLTISLIEKKRIVTSLAKAKALRMYVEPILSRGKEDTLHNRRIVFSHLQNKQAVTELFRVIGEKIADRPGGYTRIFKMGFRKGDGTELALIELVDFNENYQLPKKEVQQKKRSRRGRGGSKKSGKETSNVAVEVESAKEVESSTEGGKKEDTASTSSPEKKGEEQEVTVQEEQEVATIVPDDGDKDKKE